MQEDGLAFFPPRLANVGELALITGAGFEGVQEERGAQRREESPFPSSFLELGESSYMLKQAKLAVVTFLFRVLPPCPKVSTALRSPSPPRAGVTSSPEVPGPSAWNSKPKPSLYARDGDAISAGAGEKAVSFTR